MHGDDQWIESALLTFLWMSTLPESKTEPTSLCTVLDELYQVWQKKLSAEATHGALVVSIWSHMHLLAADLRPLVDVEESREKFR